MILTHVKLIKKMFEEVKTHSSIFQRVYEIFHQEKY